MTARIGKHKRECVYHVANEPWTEAGCDAATDFVLRRLENRGNLKNRVRVRTVRNDLKGWDVIVTFSGRSDVNMLNVVNGKP